MTRGLEANKKEKRRKMSKNDSEIIRSTTIFTFPPPQYYYHYQYDDHSYLPNIQRQTAVSCFISFELYTCRNRALFLPIGDESTSALQEHAHIHNFTEAGEERRKRIRIDRGRDITNPNTRRGTREITMNWRRKKRSKTET